MELSQAGSQVPVGQAESQGAVLGQPIGPAAGPVPASGAASVADAPTPAPDLREPPAEPDSVGGFDTAGPAPQPELSGSWQEGQFVADRFRIQRLIGQGGMGKVYLAQDETLKRPIALKRIPQEILFDVDARDDLRLEANRLLDLAHENIVRIHTYYDGPTWPFFAMEFLRGPTLKEFLRERRRQGRTFTPDEARVVARQVGRGLAHAHARSIVHRDLKPANLMLAEPCEGELSDAVVVKITDFGISRVVADSTMRQTGRRSGTLPYMSPEQFRGEPSTVQSDVYSFACTLYELLAGGAPFQSGDLGYQILQVTPKPLAGVPRCVAKAIQRGLEKDPRERFSSVEDFVRALEGQTTPPERRPGRQMLALGSKALGGIVFALLVLFLASKVFQGGLRSDEFRQPSERTQDGAKTVSVAAPELQRQVEEFRQLLDQRLDLELLPVEIGRSFGTVREVDPPEITFALGFHGAKEGLSPEILARLSFGYKLAGPEDAGPGDKVADWHYVRGATEGGSRVFQFLGLREGSYLIQAFLDPTGDRGLPQPLNQARRFRVDLTPPDLHIVPQGTVDVLGSTRYGTFDDSVAVRLVPLGGSADIAAAYYQRLDGSVFTEPRAIPNPSDWEMKLQAGVDTTHRIHTVDSARNRSADQVLVFRRYLLELDEFKLAGVEGNVATVTGRLRFEGEVSPSLVFYVNDKPADWTWVTPAQNPDVRAPLPEHVGSLTAVEAVAAARSGLESVHTLPFEARLTLDRPTNSVEVRYSWKQAPARPIPRASSLGLVKVRSPEVVWKLSDLPGREVEVPGSEGEALPARRLRTGKPSVTVEGSVRPYFDGLQLDIVNEGKHARTVMLEPSTGGGMATFVSTVELLAGRENRIQVAPSYKGEPVLSSAPPIEVYYDPAPPAGRISIQSDGAQLLVTIQSTEALSRLRGRWITSEGGPASWQNVPLDDVPSASPMPVYRWRLPMPRSSVTGLQLQVELTDEAENSAEVTEYYKPPSSPERDLPSVAQGSGAGLSEASARQGAVTVIRSVFLVERGLDFVPLPSRLEFSRTELPESMWFEFLVQRGLRDEDAPAGRADYPMVLGDYPASLLGDLSKWVTERSADGYEYRVPTLDEWLCAFSGARDAEGAREDVEAWFRGGSRRQRFVDSPEEEYGKEEPSRIGSRPANASPTGLLDMESNVQELVKDGSGAPVVIGGQNPESQPEELLHACLEPRAYDRGQRDLMRRFTGFRLCRSPMGLGGAAKGTR